MAQYNLSHTGQQLDAAVEKYLQTDFNSLVNNTSLNALVGDISNLSTSTKTNIIAAINEVNTNVSLITNKVSSFATPLIKNTDYSYTPTSNLGEISSESVYQYCGIYHMSIIATMTATCSAGSYNTIIQDINIQGHTNFISVGSAELNTGSNAAYFRTAGSGVRINIGNAYGNTVPANSVFRFNAILIPTN